MLKDRINLYIIIILVAITFGCTENMSNSKDFVRNLSNEKRFDLPFKNESLMIFIRKENSIYITSIRELYNLKEEGVYKFKDFDSFLIEVINENILTVKDLEISTIIEFKFEQSFVNELNKNGIDYLKKKYCESTKIKGKIYLKHNLEINTKYNIMYIFFKNNYYVMQNDYSGKYVLLDKN